MTTVYFVRHGETISNVNKIILHPDVDILSKRGVLEATLLAQHLADIKITKAFSSDYPRSVQTAEIILKGNIHAKDLQLKKEKILQELNVDSYTGKNANEVLKSVIAFLETGRPIYEFVLQGTEPLTEVKTRTISFLKDLYEEIDNDEVPDTILVVSHGMFLWCLMNYLHEAEDLNVVNWDAEAGCGRVMKNSTYMKLSIGRKSLGSNRRVEFEAIHAHSHLNSISTTDSLTKTVQTKELSPLSGCFQV